MDYQPDQDTEESAEAGTRLVGHWLLLARAVWITVALVTVVVFVASIPAFYALLDHACTSTACRALIPPYSPRQYQAAGLSVNSALIFGYALTLFSLLALLSIGAVIFAKRSYDGMALYTSFALVTFATAFESGTLLALVPAWTVPIQLLSFVGNVAFGTFLYLFPNGRFVPRWMLYLVAGWVFYSVLLFFFPTSSLTNSWAMTLLFFGLVASLLGAQVYRYRRVSSPMERQQTKWVVYGLSTAATGTILVQVLYFADPLTIFHPGPVSDLIASTVLQVFILVIPLSIAFAVLRSHLWDIDVIINRALVYGSLTGILALVYFGSILLLQFLLRGFVHQNSDAAIVISTLAIAALFQPLRRAVQSLIDRRFYRRKYDAAKTLDAFSATLRSEVDMSQLSEQLLTVVDETMQPTSVSLWLRPRELDGTRPT